MIIRLYKQKRYKSCNFTERNRICISIGKDGRVYPSVLFITRLFLFDAECDGLFVDVPFLCVTLRAFYQCVAERFG